MPLKRCLTCCCVFTSMDIFLIRPVILLKKSDETIYCLLLYNTLTFKMASMIQTFLPLFTKCVWCFLD